MSVQVLSPGVKPQPWNLHISRIAPNWQWFWRRPLFSMPLFGPPWLNMLNNDKPSLVTNVGQTEVFTVNDFGRAVFLDRTSAGGDGTLLSYSANTIKDGHGPFTAIVLHRWDGEQSGTFRASVASALSNTDGFRFFITSGNDFRFRTAQGGSGVNADVTLSHSANDFIMQVGIYDGSEINHIVHNLTQRTTASTTAAESGTIDHEGFSIGSSDSTVENPWSGDIVYCHGVEYALSTSSVQRLFVDPFGPFRPARRVAVIVPAGAVTVIPDSISGTWATQDPTLSFGGITQLPTSVAGTWSTQDPTLTFTFFPASVSGTWASQNPALSFGAITQSPASVSGTWATQDPALTFGAITVSPVSVSGTWSTQDPTVVSGLQTITPPAVTGSWASQAPSMSFGAITRSPSEIAGTWAVSAVATAFGGVTVSAASVSGTWATQPVSSTLGATTKTPAAVSGTWNSRAPTLTGGAVTFSPASISGTWAVSTLTVVTGVFTVVSPTSGSITSTVTTGSITSTTTSATITTTDTSADIDSEV